jgi:hypothetical protein
MNPWWLGLQPAQATVACGEHTHRLRWEAGALWARDHDDPEAERALAALGGPRCTCVDMLDAWAHHNADPRVLVLASRGPADPLAAHADWIAQLGALHGPVIPAMKSPPRMTPRQLLRRPGRRRARSAAGGPAAYAAPAPLPAGRIPHKTQAESELIALLGLGGGLQDRLVADVAAAWAERFEQPDEELGRARPTLHASMQGRLAAAVRSWLGRIDIELELSLIETRHAPALTHGAGVIRVELPFGWLAEVWSRGLAVVMGRLCLAASTDDGRVWTLTTVGPDLGPTAPVRVELPASG